MLLGDSHLARVRRDLPVLGNNVCNAAEGGASSLDLLDHAASAGVDEHDVIVVSVGTNDAAPWKRVALPDFVAALSACLGSVEPRGWVHVSPPGVVEARLTDRCDRSNSTIDEYRTAAMDVFREVGARVVRTDLLIGPLGATAFADDGVHLNASGYRVLLPALAAALRSQVADARWVAGRRRHPPR